MDHRTVPHCKSTTLNPKTKRIKFPKQRNSSRRAASFRLSNGLFPGISILIILCIQYPNSFIRHQFKHKSMGRILRVFAIFYRDNIGQMDGAQIFAPFKVVIISNMMSVQNEISPFPRLIDIALCHSFKKWRA